MTLLDLLKLMRKHLKLMIALPILCALVTAIFSWGFLPDAYTAKASMYVLTKSSSESDTITNTDLTASQMLTNDVAMLIKSSRVTKDTASSLGMSSLSEYGISVNSETTTRVISVSVTGESAEAVAAIANELAITTDKVAQDVMDLKSVNIIDEAKTPSSPSGPPRLMYTAMAFLIGIFLALAIVILADLLDTRVRNPEEIEEMLGIPVVGRIPAARS